MRKKIALLVLLTMISNFLSGCYDARETDELAYVIALGIDKGKTNSLKFTLQLVVPKNIGGGGQGGSGGGGGEPYTIIVVEAPSVFAAMNMANALISRQINLSHTKAVVFSKELAEEGVAKYINSMYRYRDFRLNMYILVSRTSAEEFIRSVKPKLETNPSKYYELALERHRYTASAADTRFYNFYHLVRTHGGQAFAMLAGVNDNKSSSDINLKDSTYKEKGRAAPLEGDFIAGGTSAVGAIRSEIMGLAVFRGDKMVGELDGEETAYQLMVTGKHNYSYFTIPDPKSKGNYIVYNIKQSRKPSVKGEFVGDKPHAVIKLSLETDILSIQSGINYEDTKKIPILEKSVEDFIKTGVVKFLEKTRDEYNSDICSIGDSFRSKFLTWKEWDDYRWLDKYKDASFDVQVDVKIRRPGLMVYTSGVAGAAEQGEGQK